MNLTHLLPLGLCAALLAACDDDEDQRSVPPFDSELGGSDTPVGDLSEVERQQICGRFDGYLDATVGFDQIAYAVCLPGAIVLGGSPEGCQSLLDDCMSLRPDPIRIRTSLTNADACAAGLAGCNISVAELEGCINLNFSGLIRILENFSCSGAQDEDQRSYARELMETANVCADASAACHNLGEVTVF